METGYSDTLDPLLKEIRICSEKLRDDIFLDLLKVAGTIYGYMDQWLMRRSISREGFWIVQDLVVFGGRLTPTAIARKLLVPKYIITRNVDRLGKMGMVKREPYGDDRRTRDIVVTEKGIQLIREYLDYFQTIVMPGFFSRINKKQAGEFHDNILNLREYLIIYKHEKIKMLTKKGYRI